MRRRFAPSVVHSCHPGGQRALPIPPNASCTRLCWGPLRMFHIPVQTSPFSLARFSDILLSPEWNMLRREIACCVCFRITPASLRSSHAPSSPCACGSCPTQNLSEKRATAVP